MDLGLWPFSRQICINICKDLNFLLVYRFQGHLLVGSVFLDILLTGFLIFMEMVRKIFSFMYEIGSSMQNFFPNGFIFSCVGDEFWRIY